MSDVVRYQATPEMLAELEQRAARKYGGPEVKRWERTMTREQYLAARLAGTKTEDIMLSYFNNDPMELRKQLREWGIDKKVEKKELAGMAQGRKASELTITKQEYLQRRLNGEKRGRIQHSLGVTAPRFYELLDKWGIREMDAESRALEMMAPVPNEQGASPEARVIDKRLAEQLERQGEARGLIALNAQNGTTQQTAQYAGAEVLQRMEERAAAQAEEIQNLQVTAQQSAKYVKDLEGELTKARDELEKANSRFKMVSEENRKELYDLSSMVADLQATLTEKEVQISELRADRDNWESEYSTLETVYGELKQALADLEAERDMLLQTIEQAASRETGIISFRIPIQSADIANAERTKIYEALEALSNRVEAANIDRGRVMKELFELLQRVVNFVSADLVDLLPCQGVNGFIYEFFRYYNQRHVESLPTQQEAI